ncbi:MULTISPECIES: heme exporter protein CcmB [Halocynthiibacter]|uniref:Heme exporter protein B n=1 Tax=Halocynthiibacter halioticoli TaxID=2986804 RepID=A0AAE3J024_9RHOB|nr:MULTISPECIES: heme exporter protein CcmB [Halocynthiibacter]MCV6824048.1 heme exporter protein CcmB [Halocynthiibacter halioticoli]MCW4057049.1 heme exporter protein CcmB [Halocynthiibacter sp. SDUM655004]MDE0589925.1 heme exporter protein CcmB [Halocynthiibacter sp. C4]
MIALLLRDIRLSMRSGGGFGLALAFFLIVIVLVPFGVGPETSVLGTIAPGILWVGALLACLLSLDRIFALDYDDGSLDLMATSPLPLEGVVVVKALAHWITTGVPLTLIAPVLALLLNLPQDGYFWLLVTLAIGTPALSIIGTFGAALTVGLKRGGLLLSLLVLPMYVPTLIFGAEALRRGMRGMEAGVPLLFLAAISLAALALLPLAAAAAIRINLR